MATFGFYVDKFFKRLCHNETIFNEIRNDINILDKYLMSNNYFYVHINDDISSILNSYTLPINFFSSLLKTENQMRFGFNQIKIIQKVHGNPDLLLKTVDVYDDFFFRIFGVTKKIFNYFNKNYELMKALLNINAPFENRYIFDITNCIPITNYFTKIFELDYKSFNESDFNKSIILNSIICFALIKYQQKIDYLYSTYSMSLLFPFVSAEKLKEGFNLYINTNINDIVLSLYKYLYHNNLMLRRESNLFNEDNLLKISAELQPELFEAFKQFIDSKKINQYNIINKIYNRYCIANAYDILVSTLYTNNTYNTNYLTVDLHDLLDIEHLIETRYTIKFLNDFKQELEALQIFSLQYKQTPLFFVNTQLFLHAYWINNLIFDKEYIALTELFNVFYNTENLMNFIYSNVDFKTETNLEQIVFNKFKSLDNLRLSIKLSLIDLYRSIMFEFFTSDVFKKFLVEFMKNIIEKVNEYYYYDENLYKFVDAAILFFKYKILKDYVDDKLFNDINNRIYTNIAAIINNTSPPDYTLQKILTNQKQHNHINLFNFINNYTFSCKVNEYLLNIFKDYAL